MSAPHEGLPGVPAATGEQVPTLPLKVHESHPSAHEALQQTPPAQKPVEHCRGSVQLPLVWAATHWLLELQ